MKKRYYTFIIIAFIGVAGFIHSNDSLFEISRSLEIYANTYKEINNLYVDEINPTSIMNVGISCDAFIVGSLYRAYSRRSNRRL